MLEAKKNQSSDELESEKLNTTHTKHNLNPWGNMKDRSDGKLDYKGGVGTQDWQLQDKEQKHAWAHDW